MKALLAPLKELDKDSTTAPAVFIQAGPTRYDFICYGDGTMAVRTGGSGIMSPQFNINWVGVKKAIAWIDSESK